jgi:Protein of unknown function (DUF4238)
MANRPPKRHHIQPQVLLRQFADTNNKIAVINKRDRTKKLKDVKKVSVVKHANTLKLSSGLDYSLEEALSKIENFYPAIIASLDRVARTPEEDAFVLTLVTTQMARDPFYRGWLREDVEAIYEALRVALLEDDPKLKDMEIAQEWEHYAKGNIVKPYVEADPKNVEIAGTLSLIRLYYESLQPYSLSILRAKLGSFITADSPLSLYDGYVLAGTETTTHDMSVSEETEILFPITSQHAALITRDALKPLFDVENDIVAIVNARTVRTAAVEIYCHPHYDTRLLARDLGMWWWRRPLQADLRLY